MGQRTGARVAALPAGLTAVFDRSAWEVPPLFQFIQNAGRVDRDEMYRVFNMGIGMIVFVRPDATEETPASTAQSQSEEPASSELLRCREIGAAALDDAGCKKAWADSRRHFLEGDAGRARP